MRIALSFLFALAMSSIAAKPPITSSPWTTNYGNTGSNTMFRFVWPTTTASGHPSEIAFTTLGGIAIRMMNGTGSNSVLGQMVCSVSGYTTNVYNTLTTNELGAGQSSHQWIGVVGESGVSESNLTWIVIKGRAYVLEDTDIGGPYFAGFIATPSKAQFGKVHLNAPSHTFYDTTNVGSIVGITDGTALYNDTGTNLVRVILR